MRFARPHSSARPPVPRSRARRSLLFVLAQLSAALAATTARAQSTIAVPDVRGDQILFVYDARPNRTSFLLVSNPGDDPVTVEVALYPASLDGKLASTTLELASAGHSVIDPASIAAGAAAGSAGLAVVTPIRSAGDPTPVVPSAPLAGSFTLANTALQSAFGENGFGRLAVGNGGSRAAAGTAVDGSTVRYQRIAPAVLAIPVYFAPASLGPAANDGNRVVLASFSDRYDGGFSIAPATAARDASFFGGNGVRSAERALSVSGVLLSDLQSVAGPEAVLPGSGKVFFAVSAPNANVLGVFSQSLGTFASGHRMSAVAAVPVGTVSEPAGCAQADVTASVGWDDVAFPQVSGVAIRVGYAPALVILPGSGASDALRARVTNLTDITDGLLEASDQPRPGSATDDQASVALVSLAQPIAPGPFVRVRFDCVGGAAVPGAGDFSCVVEAATLDGAPVAPASCTLAVATSD